MAGQTEGRRLSVSATILAPAKLTLSLRVTGVRPDGYHLVDAEMVSLDLADELTFTDGSGLEIVDAGTAVVGAPPSDDAAPTGELRPGVPAAPGLPPGVPAGNDNLVRRALRAVGRDAHVRLVKRIPAGGGLGGGSADAAAVLRWAGASADDGVGLAATLGADVPFCLRGGRARVSGIGDEMEPLPYVERTFTLLTPPFGCSTVAVYRAWDALGGPTAAGPNDLEPAALTVEPGLARWRDRLGDATGQTPVLAGSGSTWYVEGDHPGEGRVVVRSVPAYG
ncbi:MAG TPA: 4-(cytidine 5'-diphospho)-2-C-methyl-D-erythritol kinase [Acidimicrobiales bacterium]|nr:4-(cytidine 5'-diphospho)-2-C-methyl-D-erythritol kinase [Acidimicrobiales bacterium]